MKHQHKWVQLLCIQANGALCLPMIAIGNLLHQNYGWKTGLFSIVLGNLFLLFIALGLAFLNTCKPQSTARHAKDLFGNLGGMGFSLLLLISMLGWFAIGLNLMSLHLSQLFTKRGLLISPFFVTILLGASLSYITGFGMCMIKKASTISAPLLGCCLIYALTLPYKTSFVDIPFSFSCAGALSLVMSCSLVSTIDLPTFFLHANSKKDAIISIVLLYGLVIPCIQGVGLYLSLESFYLSSDLISIICFGIFILLCGSGTNHTNLYSAIISSLLLCKQGSFKKRALVLGGIATLIACFNALENFEMILNILGSATASMGAVILTCYLLKYSHKTICFTGFGLGILGAYLSMTGAATLDAFFIAACAVGILNLIYQKRKNYEASYKA